MMENKNKMIFFTNARDKLKGTKSHDEQKAIRWNDFIYHTYKRAHSATVGYVFIKFLETVNECGGGYISHGMIFLLLTSSQRIQLINRYDYKQPKAIAAEEEEEEEAGKLCKKEKEYAPRAH